jgi:hypothetical protein
MQVPRLFARNESQLQLLQYYQATGRSLGNVTTHLLRSPFHESCISEGNVLPILAQSPSNTVQSEQVDSVGKISGLYSDGARFESRPEQRLFPLMCSVDFSSLSIQILG